VTEGILFGNSKHVLEAVCVCVASGRVIIRRYRPDATNDSLARGHDVTFDEFVQYLGDHPYKKNEKPLDAHWRPFSELCLPCQVCVVAKRPQSRAFWPKITNYRCRYRLHVTAYGVPNHPAALRMLTSANAWCSLSAVSRLSASLLQPDSQ
jgi:Sulfotransferase family